MTLNEAAQLRIANDAANAALYAGADLRGFTPEMRRSIEHARGRHAARIQASQRRHAPVYRVRVGTERVTVVHIEGGWRVHHTATEMVLATDGAWISYEGPATPGIVWSDQEAAEEAAIASVLGS
ncbi:hypothetical protein ACGFJC_47085 [Nonomuraea fuscirosea]|uniref:hypothetical protein n=1 Tax=Nonomuraea fuscirosea TaxID=1291556 RepID=UPI003712A4CC